eukprot:a846204_48.p1 GENE.a846204_48~~a846204_48.p1  ORF type:complete len:455 (+),score=157.78 a846204_48:33-1367(+)
MAAHKSERKKIKEEYAFTEVILPHDASNMEVFGLITRAFGAKEITTHASFRELYSSIARLHGERRTVDCLDELPSEFLALFETVVLPLFGEVVEKLPALFPETRMPALRQGVSAELVLSRVQVLALNVFAFMNAFAPSMSGYSMRFVADPMPWCVAKTQAVVHYFARVARVGLSELRGRIVLTRQVLDDAVEWTKADGRLAELEVRARADGTIEDDGIGMLQADFANEFIGGGVMDSGRVQEEIRFGVTNPELLVSILFCPRMCDNETILLKGAERFSDYTGYASSLQWGGDHVDSSPRDDDGTFATTLVAFDALPFAEDRQWEPELVRRELDKAYCAFLDRTGGRTPIATGNWGCGAFRGDKRLKTVVQILAAAHAGMRPVAFFTFGDRDLVADTRRLAARLAEKDATVGGVFASVLDFVRSPAFRRLERDERGAALLRALEQ